MSPCLSFLLLLVMIQVLSSATGGLSTVNILAANLELRANDYLRAADYYLVMQEDCDLVLYQGTQAWKSTSGRTSTIPGGNCRLAMQADGNLVMYNTTEDKPENAFWSSGTLQTARKFSYYLLLQSSGSLEVYDAFGNSGPLAWIPDRYLTKVGADFQPPANVSTILGPKLAWKPPTLSIVHSFMYVGYQLSELQQLADKNGRYKVTMDSDCNVKVNDTKPGYDSLVWQSGTVDPRHGPCQLTLQEGGRLVILGKSMEVVWNSSSKGDNPNVNWVLSVSDLDGNLAVVDLLHQDTVLWSASPDGYSVTLPGQDISPPGLPGPASTTSAPNSLPQTDTSPTSVTKSPIFRVVVGTCIGCIFFLSVVVFVLLCYSRRRTFVLEMDPAAKALQRRFVNNGGKATQALTLERITQATNNFTMKIGHGGFGDVFYGKLEDGQEVAVKVLSESSHQSKEEFYNEIELLSMVHHKYLVSLVGYCLERKHQMLVYEYVKEGDLRKRLKGDQHAGANALTWDQRRSIILQVAEGLEYLHDKCSPSIIHRDVKSNNILLTEKLVAKVADFGLSKLRAMDQESASHVTTVVRGTRGYFDPQYFETGMLTEKSDVFAFGIVMMETLTGKNQSSLALRVYESWKTETSLTIADPNLKGELNEYEFLKLVKLSLWCVKKKSLDRPSMTQVAHNLRTLFFENQVRSFLTDVAIERNEFDFHSQ